MINYLIMRPLTSAKLKEETKKVDNSERLREQLRKRFADIINNPQSKEVSAHIEKYIF
jgi:hypothetical protein